MHPIQHTGPVSGGQSRVFSTNNVLGMCASGSLPVRAPSLANMLYTTFTRNT